MASTAFLFGQLGSDGQASRPLHSIDPSQNDEPLQFNITKGPMVIESLSNGEPGQELGRRRPQLPTQTLPGGVDITSVGSLLGVLPGSNPWAEAIGLPGMTSIGVPGFGPVPSGFEPNMGLLGAAPASLQPFDAASFAASLSLFPGTGGYAEAQTQEIIHCTHCTLFPPNPNMSAPSLRERPPGCRTVFVGGLPEAAGEELIRDVFERCGELTALRKGKGKNFAHIRFAEEHMVDEAISLSGYRMRIGSSSDRKDSGRLHVDYASARDDQYEWECRQRALARHERHRRLLEERCRSPSPPRPSHYTEHEASELIDKLKDDGKFPLAIGVLLAWMERGEVTRKTSTAFYSMIQSTNSHVRRLLAEKATQEREMELARERLKNSLSDILFQFEQIMAMFRTAKKQRTWDHFTKPQRRNIDTWYKNAEKLRNAHSEELMGTREEEEMDMSDEEQGLASPPSSPKRMKRSSPVMAEFDVTLFLQEQNRSLRGQLEVSRNELELLRQELAMANAANAMTVAISTDNETPTQRLADAMSAAANLATQGSNVVNTETTNLTTIEATNMPLTDVPTATTANMVTMASSTDKIPTADVITTMAASPSSNGRTAATAADITTMATSKELSNDVDSVATNAVAGETECTTINAAATEATVTNDIEVSAVTTMSITSVDPARGSVIMAGEGEGEEVDTGGTMEVAIKDDEVGSGTTTTTKNSFKNIQPEHHKQQQDQQQQQLLQQALQWMKQQLCRVKEELCEREAELAHMCAERRQAQAALRVIQLAAPQTNSDVQADGSTTTFNSNREASVHTGSQGFCSDKQALLIGLAVGFLQIHPSGASAESLRAYLLNLKAKVTSGELDSLLCSLPCLFSHEWVAGDAVVEKKWRFCGYEQAKRLTGHV
uniref:ecto-NOX disulfide-thiol exchanger 1-like isoform X1 n=1 Tax=Myxine glutinosa TaxID=7769 RepID=UPI00358F4FB9